MGAVTSLEFLIDFVCERPGVDTCKGGGVGEMQVGMVGGGNPKELSVGSSKLDTSCSSSEIGTVRKEALKRMDVWL